MQQTTAPVLAAANPTSPKALLEIDPQEFAANFNRRPFLIRHHLCDHPLFALPNLLELARRLPQTDIEYNAGDIPISLEPHLMHHTGLSIEETIRRIEECKSWMVLKHVENDAAYRTALPVSSETGSAAPGMMQLRASLHLLTR